jgi:hypothetical protein
MQTEGPQAGAHPLTLCFNTCLTSPGPAILLLLLLASLELPAASCTTTTVSAALPLLPAGVLLA